MLIISDGGFHSLSFQVFFIQDNAKFIYSKDVVRWWSQYLIFTDKMKFICEVGKFSVLKVITYINIAGIFSP